MVFPNPLPLPRVFRFRGTNFSQSAWVIMADRNTQVTICRIEHERFPPPCLEIAITGKGSRMLCTQFFAHLATNQGCGKLTLSSATSQHARMEDIGFLFLFLFLSYQHLAFSLDAAIYVKQLSLACVRLCEDRSLPSGVGVGRRQASHRFLGIRID